MDDTSHDTWALHKSILLAGLHRSLYKLAFGLPTMTTAYQLDHCYLHMCRTCTMP